MSFDKYWQRKLAASEELGTSNTIKMMTVTFCQELRKAYNQGVADAANEKDAAKGFADVGKGLGGAFDDIFGDLFGKK